MGEVWLLETDCAGDAVHIFAAERKVAEQHGLQNDSQTETVEFVAILFSFEAFWGHLIGSALKSADRGVGLFAKAQVYNLYFIDNVLVNFVSFEFNKNIL